MSRLSDELRRGYKAIDTDEGWRHLTEDADVLFVAGSEESQVRFHSRFDCIILLSAPLETQVERLAIRASRLFRKGSRGTLPRPCRRRNR